MNRHLQNLLQHGHVQRLTATQDSSNGLHDALAKLLHTIFHTHPSNTCQPSHLPPLIQIYGGTLSSADLHILGVFRLYEAQRRISVASLIGNWSAPGNSASQSCLDAISYLDPGQVLRTFMNFPTQRSLDDVGEFKVSPGYGQIYDPVFVMLLFAQVVSSCPPSSALGWVQLFRTNVASLIIRCLSSRDSGLRRLARVQLGALYKLIEASSNRHVFGFPNNNRNCRLPKCMKSRTLCTCLDCSETQRKRQLTSPLFGSPHTPRCCWRIR